MPIAAPGVPNEGIGPSPRISTTLKHDVAAPSVATPRIIGVRASPAERSAPPSMKKTSMPLLNRNMMRRNGSASRLHRRGGVHEVEQRTATAKYPIGAITQQRHPDRRQERLIDRAIDLVASPAPAKRATSTLMPVNSDVMKTMTMTKICQRHADRGVAGEADEVADHDVIDHALQPADDVREHRRPRDLPDRRGGAVPRRSIGRSAERPARRRRRRRGRASRGQELMPVGRDRTGRL